MKGGGENSKELGVYFAAILIFDNNTSLLKKEQFLFLFSTNSARLCGSTNYKRILRHLRDIKGRILLFVSLWR